jgi:hypothetical protein
MTRKEVFFSNYNPNLQRLESWHSYRFIGNETRSTIRNNNYLQVNNELYLLDDFDCLNLLLPNTKEVVAYWLPDADGRVEKVYLYQGDTYIGSATTAENYRYNEAKVERTDEDTRRLNLQLGRSSHFNKLVKEINAGTPKIAILDGENGAAMRAAAEKTAIITSTDKDGEEDYSSYGITDYAAQALADF